MPIYEGKNIDEAIKNGLTALSLKKEAVDIQIIEDAKKGFLGMGKKNAKVSIEPTVTEDITEAVSQTVAEVVQEPLTVEETVTIEIEEPEEPVKKQLEELEDEAALTELSLYLTKVTKAMGTPALVRIERTQDLIIMHLDTEKQGALIGKHGKVLNAVQYLAQVFLHRAAKNKLSVMVNVGDYREKRQQVLNRLAKKTAEKVKATGHPVFLEPMPAFERKMIHSVLSKDGYVKTHSEGDEPYRYLVVEPEKRNF